MSDNLLHRIGRVLRPLFQPDYARDTERLNQLAVALKEVGEQLKRVSQEQRKLHEASQEQRSAAEGFRDRLAQQRREDLGRVTDGLNELRGDVRRQASFTGRLLKRGERADEWAVDEQRVRERLVRMARSPHPILVGPWTGEIGFELLYWIPFVRWVCRKYSLDPSRLIVMSRGGTATWYRPLADRYVDVFDFMSPDEFRAALAAGLKQRAVRELDTSLARRVRSHFGLRRFHLLHPSMMYALLFPFWKHQLGFRRVEEYTAYERLGAVDDHPALKRLPERYVAVRFYFSNCFPDTPENRRLVADTLAGLTAQTDVVLLNPGFQVDDHHDYAKPIAERIHSLEDAMVPARNLALQTAVIARSSGYVGTYGGFAYLAPFHGVNAVAFYSIRNFFIHHLELAQHAFDLVGGGRLAAIDAGLAPLASQALADLPVSANRSL